MGAMLRFKQQMGYEVTAMKGESFTDTLTLLWCCVASACACSLSFSCLDTEKRSKRKSRLRAERVESQGRGR